ncbi:isocitrate lyase/PEP mutase family protein [Hoeflea poritis]|uniref:Isocitrate lyase/phosphoenolpyruvate mutase family protein n=1 Tax=Hoeflea poritis TaxID=2993659 RepID=A0ABT4VNP2_9HYPH|nr:isocitrate lyase/phosphoenolpyruvate mutase family protein [Hoeflea poritis]MDA4846234.1 isocitrate lyase/phosphoenolpyruvate mutase family protein [Hoeflea poritis]
MRPTTRLRALLNAPEFLVMPGAHDALSAKLAERAGFDAIVMGGFPVTGSLLAAPDSSQLGLSELAEHYRRVTGAVDIPLFVDADTGFGNASNVRRTTRELERAGVAGFFIEDQVFPKRCGHTPGKAVVPVEDMIAKVKAAADARTDGDLVLVARTDALAVEGLNAAIERAGLYREAGADMLFIEAPTSVEQMRRIIADLGGLHLANMIDFGMSPDHDSAELQEIGYACGLWGLSSIFTMTRALIDLYATIKADGTSANARDRMVTFDEFTAIVGLPQMREAEQGELDFARSLIQAKE